VHLDGPRADAQRRGDLLRVQPVRGEVEHLALATGELRELLAHAFLVARQRRAFLLHRERAVDRVAQLRLREGLLDEVDGLAEERRARRRHVAMRGDDHERDPAAGLAHARLQLRAREARQAQVRHDAAAPRGIERDEEALGVGERARRVPGEAEHQPERIADGRVVVDDVDDEAGLSVSHGAAAAGAGGTRRGVAPVRSASRRAPRRWRG
jgi:hypothetical protein